MRQRFLIAATALVVAATSRAGEPPREVGRSQGARFSRVVLGFTDLVGQMSVDRLTYWSFPPATNLKCRLRITDEGWRFENVIADYCGGRMNAEAAIDYTPGGRELRFVAELAGVRLEEVTRQVKYSVTPGRVNGKLELRVTAEGLPGLSGQAEMHVREASLMGLPVMLKALTFLSFPDTEKEELSEADAHMTLTPRAIVFQDLNLRSRSGSFSLEADRLGTVTYAGALDLRFKPVIPSRLLKYFPLVGPSADAIVSGIQQGIMRIRVTGTYAEPRFQWTPFR